MRLAVAILLIAVGLAACGPSAEPSVAEGASPAPAPAPAAEAAPAGGAAAAVAEPVGSPPGTLEAVGVELGTAVDPDGRVLRPVSSIRPADTVFVSLVTVGEASAAMLGVEWRDAAGTMLGRDGRAIRATGPAVHTFSRQAEGGWAPGAYEVTLTLNGEVAGTRAFEVGQGR